MMIISRFARNPLAPANKRTTIQIYRERRVRDPLRHIPEPLRCIRLYGTPLSVRRGEQHTRAQHNGAVVPQLESVRDHRQHAGRTRDRRRRRLRSAVAYEHSAKVLEPPRARRKLVLGKHPCRVLGIEQQPRSGRSRSGLYGWQKVGWCIMKSRGRCVVQSRLWVFRDRYYCSSLRVNLRG